MKVCLQRNLRQVSEAYNCRKDTRLSLRWYDAQDCFESEPIDIVEQMPQFVVMLTLLQRFNKRMWDLNTENVESEEKGTLLPDPEIRFRVELVGTSATRHVLV